MTTTYSTIGEVAAAAGVIADRIGGVSTLTVGLFPSLGPSANLHLHDDTRAPEIAVDLGLTVTPTDPDQRYSTFEGVVDGVTVTLFSVVVPESVVEDVAAVGGAGAR